MKHVESKEMFEEVIKDGNVVVMFSADWCPDCRVLDPVLPGIVADFPEFTFYYADRDKLIDLCGELDIFGIPSFLAYKDGKEVDRFVSKDRKTRTEIESFLQTALDK
ncbi:thioredoxin family protein [Anaerobacillus sp. MEB173]|uniref:thioredoxin family protein n=1 Tax=Anaerobacillus sp. MEB173 TaxID=3383345 RepID=UPI003F9159D5